MNIVRASSGVASVFGHDSTKISGQAFESIGYVSENQQLPGWMTVGGFLCYLRRFYPTWDTELEARFVRQFDLPANRKLKHLSRGMRMKAALASSLAFRPKLIVLDEPFSGLDPMVRDELGAALLEFSGESTVFLSSHDLAEVDGLATHVAFLDSGRLRLSEDMASLSARFREVQLTFETSAVVPPDLPPAWLQFTADQATVRFIDSEFHAEKTAAEVTRRFGAVQHSSFAPMTLRTIFLAVARSRGKSP
jgi:ABC-2 type transport system ATP-binding protein